MQFGVIVHGGARSIPNYAVENFLKGVKSACLTAYTILKDGGTAIDAAEAGVITMEDDPTFNAGKGSFVNMQGDVEMDAIIATDNYKIGSVGAIQNVKNPVKVARLIMEKSNHVMLVGKAASSFAQEHGISICSLEELLVESELQRRYEIKGIKNFQLKDEFGNNNPNGMDTVGCVCLDKQSNFAVAISTGGLPLKRAGRIGDTPLWGSGGYVEKIGGAAGTGRGEDLIKILIARQTIDYIREGNTAQEAANRVVQLLTNEINGSGGVIVLNKDGLGLAFNTPHMSHAYMTDDMEKIYVGV